MSPRALKDFVDTDWSNKKAVAALEPRVVKLVELFNGTTDKKDADAATRAQIWTVGVIVNAFPFAKRESVRPQIDALVGRVLHGMTGKAADKPGKASGAKKKATKTESKKHAVKVAVLAKRSKRR